MDKQLLLQTGLVFLPKQGMTIKKSIGSTGAFTNDNSASAVTATGPVFYISRGADGTNCKRFQRWRKCRVTGGNE